MGVLNEVQFKGLDSFLRCHASAQVETAMVRPGAVSEAPWLLPASFVANGVKHAAERVLFLSLPLCALHSSEAGGHLALTRGSMQEAVLTDGRAIPDRSGAASITRVAVVLAVVEETTGESTTAIIRQLLPL